MYNYILQFQSAYRCCRPELSLAGNKFFQETLLQLYQQYKFNLCEKVFYLLNVSFLLKKNGLKTTYMNEQIY